MDPLKQQFDNDTKFKPFISSIVFPVYKNINPGEELSLDFPLTLLIGKNGTNKSSILHALYGCPDGKSTGEYWFATHIDPIDKTKTPAYFYRYTIPDTGETAEVLNTMIQKKKKRDPDYWEPSRPIKSYGMEALIKYQRKVDLPVGRSMTRWNAIKKDVLYLDFRSEISAFDKAFYKDSGTISRPAHRARLRRRSKPLKKALDEKLTSYDYHKKERIYENYTFTNDQINLVNGILGSEYNRITYIEHDFYMSNSFSVYLQAGKIQNYSEAFAGSGETSIVRLVYALEKAPPRTLVLLDEPETSLHIEAQYKLQEYIIDKIKNKYLQVVISTHSPFFAKNLPACAIKILTIDSGLNGKVRIINSAPAHESSFRLGYRNIQTSKINIYVEDRLAKAILEYVSTHHLTDAERDLLTIQCQSGGANDLIKMASYEIHKAQSNIAFYFDGDCKKDTAIPGSSTIPSSNNNELKTIIENCVGECPKMPRDSENENQKIENYRKFLDYAKGRFRYLPFKNPESFIVKNHPDLPSEDDDYDPKAVLLKHVENILEKSGPISSDDVFVIQRQLLNGISEDHEDLRAIALELKSLTTLASPTI